jgi:hypothetical protein
MYREVGVSLMLRGLRHIALSISRLSPIFNSPDTLAAIKMASLILRPDRRFLFVTSFHSLSRPSLSLGSSSLISRWRHCLSLSVARFRPPGNIHSRSRRRRTKRTRPRFIATNFEDLAILVTRAGQLQSSSLHPSRALPLFRQTSVYRRPHL